MDLCIHTLPPPRWTAGIRNWASSGEFLMLGFFFFFLFFLDLSGSACVIEVYWLGLGIWGRALAVGGVPDLDE